MHHHRSIALFSTLVVGALALTACASGTPAADDRTSRVRVSAVVPSSFDPSNATSLPDFQVSRLMYDTLLRKDDTGLVPGLATSWTSTPTEVTLVLREDATCSDGIPITASVVKDSLDYFARPGAGTSTPALVFGPEGAPVITADDATGTVSIEVASAWPDLATGLSVASTGIICPAGLADPEALSAGTVAGATSGPYELASSQAGVRYSFALRSDYDSWPEWTTDVAGEAPETIDFVVLQDPTAGVNMLTAGQLDATTITADAVDRLKGNSDFHLEVTPNSDAYLLFNERAGSPFVDAELREAVAQTIDQKAFVNVVQRGIGEVSNTMVSTRTACSTGSTTALIPTDAAAASSTLRGVKIRLIGPNLAGPNGAGNEYVQEALRAAGAEVELQNVDLGTWATTVLTQESGWDMTVFLDLNFLGSLSTSLSRLTGDSLAEGGGNVGGVSNAEAEKAFAASRTVVDPDERCDLLNTAADALISRADVVPLMNLQSAMAMRDGVSVTSLGGALDDMIVRVIP